MSNGGRSGGYMASGISIESEEEWYAEDKCRGVTMELISLVTTITITTTVY